MNKKFTMTANCFAGGTDTETYLAELKTYRSIVRALAEAAEASADHVELLRKRISALPGPVTASAFTEPWCGDWACNFPILRDLFSRAGVPFRIFESAGSPELADFYKSEGVDHIPVISIWDGNGGEISRWIEAPAAIQGMKAEWKKQNPRLMELYAIKNGDKEAEKEFAKLYRRFVEEMSQWYREGMWDETTGEITA